MSQFLPASLLSPIAADFDVSVGLAGQSFTATAVAAVPSALLVSALLPRADRRRVMIGLTLLALVSDLAVALAPDIGVLLAARLVLGVALGGFWAMAVAVTAQLVPAERLGRALTLVNAGVPVATALAVPVGAWVGELAGWRAPFVWGAGVAALAAALQTATLPVAPPRGGTGLMALGTTLRIGGVWVGVLATALIYAGHFAGFTYIRPLAEHAAGVDGRVLGGLLLAFGAANMVGTALAGPLADRAPRAGVLLFPAAVGGGMLLAIPAGGTVVGLTAAILLWGIGFGGVATSLQTWGARLVPTRLEQIGGVLVTAANLAVAIGAVAGGLLVDRSHPASPLLGGILAILGGLLVAGLHGAGFPASSRPAGASRPGADGLRARDRGRVRDSTRAGAR